MAVSNYYTPYNPAAAQFNATQQYFQNPNKYGSGVGISVPSVLPGYQPMTSGAAPVQAVQPAAAPAATSTATNPAGTTSLPAAAAPGGGGGITGVPYQAAAAPTAPSAPGGAVGGGGLMGSSGGGHGPYGSVPGPTPIPPSSYQEAAGVLPQLPSMTAQAGQTVMGELQGVLSPETIKTIQDHAAQFGITSGMPGSGLEGMAGLRSLGLNVEALQQQGLGQYGNLLQGLAGTQLNPALIAQIQSENAIRASMPDPAAAAAQLQRNYMNALQQFQGGGYSSSPRWGGTNVLSPAPGPFGGTSPASPYRFPEYNPGVTATVGAINPEEPAAQNFPPWYNPNPIYSYSPPPGSGEIYTGDSNELQGLEDLNYPMIDALPF